MRATWIEVDLDRLAANLAAIAAAAGGHHRVMPVVKADAYAHGAVACGKVAVAAGCRWLAVAILDEALLLRRAGLTCDLLVLGFTPPEQCASAVAAGVTTTIFDPDTARALDEAGRRLGVRARAHLKIDTGMSRIGVRPGPELQRLATVLRAVGHVEVEGVFTHFASADCDRPFTLRQLQAYTSALDQLAAAGLSPALRHAANSAATLDYQQAHFDLVRPGLLLYGYYPSASVGRHIDVAPALHWFAKPAQVKEVEPGTAIGYGGAYTAATRMRIATLPLGYADGYPRALSNRGFVVFAAGRAPVVGRVCMDQLMVDVTAWPEVNAGSVCTVLGPGVNADQLAEQSGTIAYEILTGLSTRVPRVYRGPGH
jgi:alanine racemase